MGISESRCQSISEGTNCYPSEWERKISTAPRAQILTILGLKLEASDGEMQPVKIHFIAAENAILLKPRDHHSRGIPSDVVAGYHLSYHDIDEVTTSNTGARGGKSRHKVIVKLSEGIKWEVTKQ